MNERGSAAILRRSTNLGSQLILRLFHCEDLYYLAEPVNNGMQACDDRKRWHRLVDHYATRRRRISLTRCERFDGLKDLSSLLLSQYDEVCVVTGKDDEFCQCRSQTPGHRTSPLGKHKNSKRVSREPRFPSIPTSSASKPPSNCICKPN